MTEDALTTIRAAFPAAEWVWPEYKDICGVMHPSPYVYSHQHGWSLTVSKDTWGKWRGSFDSRSLGGGPVTTSATLEEVLAQLRVLIRTEGDHLTMILEGTP